MSTSVEDRLGRRFTLGVALVAAFTLASCTWLDDECSGSDDDHCDGNVQVFCWPKYSDEHKAGNPYVWAEVPCDAG